MATRPMFQPQNPAINHYYLGWQSCTCYAAAMGAAFDSQVGIIMTGGAVRNKTGDTSGGTTLAQVDSALNAGWHKDLSLHYGLPWADFARMINGGMAGVLQLWYGPIADSRFDAGNGFRGNHAVLVLPGWVVMDPLADGRYPGVYKYHGEAYPQSLLKTAAGRLNIATYGYKPLGSGLVYAGMTRDRVDERRYHIAYIDGGPFWYYVKGSDGKLSGRKAHQYADTTGTTCSAPVWIPGGSSSPPPSGYRDAGNEGRTCVKILKGGLAGKWVATKQSQVRVRVVA